MAELRGEHLALIVNTLAFLSVALGSAVAEAFLGDFLS